MNILIRQKRKIFLELPLKHFVHGLRQIKYGLLELNPTNASIINRMYTILLASILIMRKRKKSYIVECLPKSKWTTLNDKSLFSNPNSLIISWLQTLVLGLIGREKDFKPFWNNRCLEISKKLWLPKTDYVDLHLNLSTLSLPIIKPNSWFSMKTTINPQMKNLQKISSPLSMYTPIETWEDEGIRSRKIKIYPTTIQKKMFKQWIGTTRYVYNKSLYAIKTEESTKYNFQSLRNRFVTHKRLSGEINPEVQDWELKTPKDIRAECLRDLVKAFSTTISNLKCGNISRFNMQYRKKKTFPTIVIPKSTLSIKKNKLYLYKTYLKDGIRISKDGYTMTFEYDCRLQYKYGEWYLIVPMKVKVEDKKKEKYNIASLDPGVRTFQTLYNETHTVKIQQNTELVKQLQSKLDFFQSLRAKKNISKSHYTRRIRRLYKKMDCLIDDLHFKTIHYLQTHYRWILLPIFESQEMAMKGSNRRCNRNMLQLKHFKFKERLKSKCILDKTTDLTIVTEEYTSKTCTRCGCLNEIGSNKIFRCKECNLTCDRDINGARNILLKYINNL